MADEVRTPPPHRIARAWAAYERMADKQTPMPYTLRREAHQAFYGGASVMFHLVVAAIINQPKREQRATLDAIDAEIAEWSKQFDGYLFDDTTH